MTKLLRQILSVVLSFFFVFSAQAQLLKDPTVWKVTAKKKSGRQYELIFHVDVKDGWHVYALDPGGDGSFIAPDFHPAKSTHYKVSGKVTERGKRIDETIEDIGTVHYYHNADYVVPLTVDTNGEIKGKYGYQTCNDQTCLPPKKLPFSVIVNDPELPNPVVTSTTEDTAVKTGASDESMFASAAPTDTAKKQSDTTTEKPSEEKSLLWL